MAASLPRTPRVIFTILEPISLVAGFIGAVAAPDWFIAEQTPNEEPFAPSANSRLVALQLGNLYLLLCMIGLAVLSSTTEVKVVRNYLVALWIADIGHIALTWHALGHENFVDIAGWNAMTWGNIGATADPNESSDRDGSPDNDEHPDSREESDHDLDLPDVEDRDGSTPLVDNSSLRGSGLDADLMTVFGGKLYESARELSDHLCREDRDKKWSARLHAYRIALEAWTKNYRVDRDENLFLDLKRISAALTPQSPEASTVVHVVSAANIAILMDSIRRIKAGEEGPAGLIRTLDEDFPWCLMAHDSARAKFHEEHNSFDHALAIRSWHWFLEIASTKDPTAQDAIELGARMLFDASPEEIGYPDHIDPDTVKIMPIDGDDFDNPEREISGDQALRKQIVDTFLHIRKYIRNSRLDLAGFEGSLHTDVVLDDLFQWSRVLLNEVKATISATNARLARDEQLGAEDPVAPVEAAHGVGRDVDGGGPKTLHKGANSLKALIGAASSRAGDDHATPRNSNSERRTRPHVVEVEYNLRPRPDENGDVEMGDRDDVSEVDQRGEEGGTGDAADKDYSPSQQNEEERDVIEVNQREGQDQREEQRRRKEQERRKLEPLRSRQRDAGPRVRHPTTRSSRRQPRAPGSTSANPRAAGDASRVPGSTRAPSVPDGGEEARRGTVDVVKVPKKRNKWDPQDLANIEYLVARHGSGWSEMQATAEELDLFSIRREATNIRDKARNMKISMLRDDDVLPEKFDDVLITENDRDRLKAMGRNPDRTEADVDERGRPINTEWPLRDA